MNYKCPNAECVLGRVADRKSVNGLGFCPSCHGKGYVKESLPISEPQTLFFPQLGFQKEKRWRPMSETSVHYGAIRGLPEYTGRSVATDGILVVIERPDGKLLVGHLNSFEPLREKNGKEKQRKIDVNEGLFE